MTHYRTGIDLDIECPDLLSAILLLNRQYVQVNFLHIQDQQLAVEINANSTGGPWIDFDVTDLAIHPNPGALVAQEILEFYVKNSDEVHGRKGEAP